MEGTSERVGLLPRLPNPHEVKHAAELSVGVTPARLEFHLEEVLVHLVGPRRSDATNR